MARPYETKVEDGGGRAADGELRRLRRFWLHVVALAVADQDADWLGGAGSGRDLILQAAGIGPGYWGRRVRPLADAIRAESELAGFERREPPPDFLAAVDRGGFAHSGVWT